jgi:flagellar protein FlbD
MFILWEDAFIPQHSGGLMIKLTKFNGDSIFLNDALIEFIEETPDTVITMTTGKKILVKEDVETIVSRIIDYNRKISQ